MKIDKCKIDELRVSTLHFDGNILRAEFVLLAAGSVVGGYPAVVASTPEVVKRLFSLLESVEKSAIATLGEVEESIEDTEGPRPLFDI